MKATSPGDPVGILVDRGLDVEQPRVASYCRPTHRILQRAPTKFRQGTIDISGTFIGNGAVYSVLAMETHCRSARLSSAATAGIFLAWAARTQARVLRRARSSITTL